MNGVAPKKEGFSVNLKFAKKKDVVVVGSGPAGVIAALSAKRNGVDVLLLEREAYLGGMMTGGGIGGIGINGYTAAVEGNPIVVRGISLELFNRLQEAGGAPPGEPVTRPPIDPAVLIHLLDEMMEESGIEVLFNTIAFDAVTEENEVKGVAIANKSGGQVILADVVIDASADADIAAAAGAPFTHGRPQDGRYHGGSLDMQIGGIDVDRFIDYLKNQPNMTEEQRSQLEIDRSTLLGGGREPDKMLTIDGKTVIREMLMRQFSWEEIDEARKEGKRLPLFIATGGGGPMPGRSSAPIKDGKYVPGPPGLDVEWIDYIKKGKVPPLLGTIERVYPPPRFAGIGVIRYGKIRTDQMMSGVYECWFDHTNQEEISKAILFMRKLNKVYIEFLRERVPGFEDAYIIMESPTVGTREGRRIIGEYVLTEQDIIEAKRFPDVIAMGGPRGPDAHSITGLWGDGVSSQLTKPYDIPYRCLLPQKVDNLLVVGRCMSTSHLAFGATRDMATCMATGEAGGVAAAISSSDGIKPRSLDIRLIQKKLLDQGVVLFSEEDEARGKELLSSVSNLS
ncbi:MAG: FAD-dependent oxidoreductase [Dehalococcoidales bacterium]|nr:MAG: FAD-dependent oxidoreductase [Dehalococcoidales bacterium]